MLYFPYIIIQLCCDALFGLQCHLRQHHSDGMMPFGSQRPTQACVGTLKGAQRVCSQFDAALGTGATATKTLFSVCKTPFMLLLLVLSLSTYTYMLHL